MNSRVLKHILHLLETGKYPHVLRWHNREESEFEIVFVHKKSPTWDISFLDLAKELDKISSDKSEKYYKQENYCTRSKGRVRANLNKLVQKRCLLFKGKIEVNKSIIKRIYKLNISVSNVTYLQETPVKKKKQYGTKNVSVDVSQGTVITCPDLSPSPDSVNCYKEGILDFQDENSRKAQISSPDLSPYCFSEKHQKTVSGNTQVSTVSSPDLSPLSRITAYDEVIDDFRATLVPYSNALDDSYGINKQPSILLDTDASFNGIQKMKPRYIIHASPPKNMEQSSSIFPATLLFPVYVEVKAEKDSLSHACATFFETEAASPVDPQLLYRKEECANPDSCSVSLHNFPNFSSIDGIIEENSPISTVESMEMECDYIVRSGVNILPNLSPKEDWKCYSSNDLETGEVSMYENSEENICKKQASNIDFGNFDPEFINTYIDEILSADALNEDSPLFWDS